MKDKQIRALLGMILAVLFLTMIIVTFGAFNKLDPILEKLFNYGINGLELIILIMTLIIYTKILNVSDETLKFTKKQTSFNAYFDNFKLFNELSKRKISMVADGELFSDEKPYFENMTFENLHYNYIKILEKFPFEGNTIKYTLVFKRYNHKVQSFIHTLHRELVNIFVDEDLSNDDKSTLLYLYRDFLLYDYENLSADLIQNLEMNDQMLSPSNFPDYLLKCNYNNKINFDVEEFLVLYRWLQNPR